MSKRYKANRSLHYVADDGTDRLVAPDDWVVDLTPAKERDLLADGFIRESRAKD